RFYICPKGTPEDSVSFSLALERKEYTSSPLPDGFKVDVKFNVYLYNHFENNFIKISGNQGSAVHFEGKKTRTWAYPSLPQAHLTNPANGYLLGDECMFGIEVLLCDKEECLRDCLLTLNGEATGRFTYKMKHFSKKILELQKKTLGISPSFKVGKYKCSIMYSLYNRDGELGDGPVLKLVSRPWNNRKDTESDMFFSLQISFRPFQLEDIKEKWCKRLKTKVLLRVKDQSLREEHVQVEGCHWLGRQTLCWPRFMELAAITNPDKGFLVNDTLIIEAQVSVLSSLTRFMY
ncbi:hypothetical protein FRX31_027931, partial [Thalictrum thalictroides]